MGKLRPFVRKDSYMPNKKWIPFVIGNGYTTTDGASGPAPEYETVTGNPVSFNAITPFPLKQLSVAFSPVQSGTGDPSPDNVRPISGWDSLTVEQRGKNLLNPNTVIDDSWIDTNTGAVESGHTGYVVSDYIPVVAGESYTKSGYGNSNRAFRYASDKTPLSRWSSGTVTMGEDVAFVRITVQKTVLGTSAMVEKGSSATEYAPYNGRTISITIGSTVYSGTVDVLTGVVTVDSTSYVLDGVTNKASDIQYFSETSDYANCRGKYNALLADLPNDVPYNDGKSICSHFKWYTYGSRRQAVPDSIYFSSSTKTVRWCSDTFTTLEQFNQYLVDQHTAGTPVTLVYTLGTPTTIQLTPQEVESLLGDNVLFSDSNGDLTVTYRSN